MRMDFNYENTNGLANALGGRIDLLEKMLGLKVREGLKYADIQKIVKSGFAKEFFDLGDEIMTTYTATDGTVYDFPWRIVDFRDVTWEDGSVHPGMVLQAVYSTAEKIPYDPAEANYSNGCAYWPHSTVRQWLNSDAEVGNWWIEQHEGDVAPDELNTFNGFMHGVESDFLNVIKPTRVFSSSVEAFDPDAIDHASISYDKFFIASSSELYGTRPDGYWNPLTNKYFEYWVKTIDTSAPSSVANNKRKITPINEPETARAVATRSYSWTSFLYGILYVMSDGSTNTRAYCISSRNILPCCVIS